MGETIERRLKDYKGFRVTKTTYNKGTKQEETVYFLDNEEDETNINVYKTLKELKHDVDTIWT